MHGCMNTSISHRSTEPSLHAYVQSSQNSRFLACIHLVTTEQQLHCMLTTQQQLQCMLTEPDVIHQMSLLTGGTTAMLTCDRSLAGADCSSNTCISSTDGHAHISRCQSHQVIDTIPTKQGRHPQTLQKSVSIVFPAKTAQYECETNHDCPSCCLLLLHCIEQNLIVGENRSQQLGV